MKNRPHAKKNPKTYLATAIVGCALLVAVATAGSSEPMHVTDTWQSYEVGLPAGQTVALTPSNDLLTVTSAGQAIGTGSTDSFGLVSQSTVGNMEVESFLTSIGNEANAESGLMVRVSVDPSAPFVYVGITSNRELRFRWRSSAGALASETLGALVPASDDVLLRLTRSGSAFAGYYSVDGINWTVVGSAAVPMSGLVHAGLAVSSGSTATATTTVFKGSSVVTNVPQRKLLVGGVGTDNGLRLWLRADTSIDYENDVLSPDYGRVSKWEDQSGYANDAVAPGGSGSAVDNRPLLTWDSFGIKPSIYFDNEQLNQLANRKFLTVADHASLNPLRISMFAVARWANTPTTTTGLLSKGGGTNGYLVGFSNGAPRIRVSGTQRLWGTTLSTGQPHLIEGVYRTEDPIGVRLYADGQSMAPASKTGNMAANLFPLSLGQHLTANVADPSPSQVYPYSGEIVELLVFNQGLPEEQRREVEAYFRSKYKIASLAPPKALPPTILLPAGIYAEGQTLEINVPLGALVFYSIDGGAAQRYDGAFTLPAGMRSITAWTEKPGHADSDPVTVPIIVDADARMSRDGLALWLRADAGVKLDGQSVLSWVSQIGNFTATAGSGRPTFLSEEQTSLNGRPALNFDMDWLMIPKAAGLALSDQTLCIVARPTTLGDTNTFSSLITRFSSVSGSNNGYHLAFKGNQLRYRLAKSAAPAVETFTLTPSPTDDKPNIVPVIAGAWQSFMASFGLNNQTINPAQPIISLRINGAQKATGVRNGPVGDSNSNLLIGAQFFKDGTLSPATSKCTTCGHFKVHHLRAWMGRLRLGLCKEELAAGDSGVRWQGKRQTRAA